MGLYLPKLFLLNCRVNVMTNVRPQKISCYHFLQQAFTAARIKPNCTESQKEINLAQNNWTIRQVKLFATGGRKQLAAQRHISLFQSFSFCLCSIYIIFLKKWANPGLFFIYFRLFKHTLQFLQQINVKNVHPVYGAGIRTHNLWNMSLLP